MPGAGRMRDHGYPIEWGVGRHGPGNNVFAYFAGPEEFPIELTGELLQIDDTYVPHGPDYCAGLRVASTSGASPTRMRHAGTASSASMALHPARSDRRAAAGNSFHGFHF